MWLTRASIERPVACAMFFVAIAVLGYRSYSHMLVERTPRVDIPIITITTSYPGAGPEEIETLVTDPIEEAVSSVNNLKHVTSVSRDGVSIVSVEFIVGIDLDAALADVRQKMDGVIKNLPVDVQPPVVTKVDISAQPVLTVGISSSRPIAETKHIAQKIITDRFQQVPGVAGAPVTGGEDREIKVLVDKGRLDAYGLTVDDVAKAIGADTVDVPSGNVREPAQQFPVRVIGQYHSVNEIADTRLHFSAANGRPDLSLRLGDIASVYDGVAELDEMTRVNGQNSVTISVQKTSEANTIAVVDGVKQAIQALKKQLPDLHFTITMDQSQRVRDDQNEVMMHLLIDIALVIFTVWLFLHELRGTVIVALAIPTALLATFIPMYFGGLTLNIMTMLGLLVVIGVLVDDAIVVLENIFRHLEDGEAPKEAAFNGRTEIGLAAIAITLTDVVVFLPIVFMPGQTGMFFRTFALTVVVAALFSLFVSFSLTPMLASVLYRRGESIEARGRVGIALERFWHSLDVWYRGVLDRVLHPESSLRNVLLVLVALGAAYVFCTTGLLWRAWKEMSQTTAAAIGWQSVVGGVIHSIPAMLWILALPFGLMLAWNIGARWFLAIAGTAFVAHVLGKVVGLSPQVTRFAVLAIVWGGGIFLAATCNALPQFFSLRARAAVIFTGFAVLLIAQTLFIPKLGYQFIPSTDASQIAILVETPEGTSLMETDKVVHKLESLAMQYPGVEYITTDTGQVTGGFRSFGDQGPQYAIVSLDLYDRRTILDRLMFWRHNPHLRDVSDQDMAIALRKQVAKIPGAKITVMPIRGFGGAAAPVQIEVRGYDLNAMNTVTSAIMAKLKSFPFVLNPDTSWRVGQPEVHVRIDRVRASQLGFSVADVGRILRDSIEGNTDYYYREGSDEYYIRVQLDRFDRNSVEAVSHILIGQRAGSPIYLADVADVRFGLGPNKIERRERQRRILVTANLTKGMPLGNAMQIIMPQIMKIPQDGCLITVAGEAERLNEDQGNFAAAFGLSIILVYILMSMLFESLLHPFTIMFCLPMAMVGAIAALAITGMTLSVISIIGFIMLMGLVTKNAILLIDFTNTLRRRGHDRDEALRMAGPARLRPILMTTLTLIVGLLPVSLQLGGPSSASRAPLAVAVQGGLMLSTFLTLLVIPCLYSVFDDAVEWSRERIIRVKNRLLAGRRVADEAAL